MKASSRIALFAATLAVAVGGASAPAFATTSGKWSKSQCTAYAKKYTKSSKSGQSSADKTLKSHKCTNKVS
jgi:hypothetical protein